MKHGQIGLAAAASFAIAMPAGAGAADKIADPLSFFEGRTETISTVKIVMKKPFKSRSIGRGKLLGDRSLDLLELQDVCAAIIVPLVPLWSGTCAAAPRAPSSRALAPPGSEPRAGPRTRWRWR